MEHPYRDLDYESRIKAMQETRRREDEEIRFCCTQHLKRLESLGQSLEKVEVIQQQSHPKIRNSLDCVKERLGSFGESINKMEYNFKRLLEEFRNAQLRGESYDVHTRIDLMMKTQQWEHKQNRSSLNDIERQVEGLYQRIHEMEASCQQQYLGKRIQMMVANNQRENQKTRCIYEELEDTKKSLYSRLEKVKADNYEEYYQKLRSALTHEEENLKSLYQRISKGETKHTQELENLRVAMKEKVDLVSFSERINMMMGRQQLYHMEMRADLEQEKENLKMHKKRISDIEASLQQHSDGKSETGTPVHHEDDRADLEQEKENLKMHKKQISDIEASLRQHSDGKSETVTPVHHEDDRIKELKAELQNMRCICEEKDAHITNLTQRNKELKADLQNMSFALKEKDEELKSFKDRVAEQVAPSIKTGKVLSLNSPVTKSRIQEMYDDLRSDWPQIKDSLKSTYGADNVKSFIQEMFEYARAEMEKKKKQADQFFKMDNYSSVEPSQKIEQFIQLNIQNLQLVIYNQKCNRGSKKPEDGLEYLRSECLWLGCLMALNNPPLQPDWENHPPSMSEWDILPRHISVSSERNQDNPEQQSMSCFYF